MSDAQRQKLSLAKAGKKPWNVGVKMSDASRHKLSLARTGQRPWNAGLTKDDPRVLRNTSGGSAEMQFKSGARPDLLKEGNPSWKGGRIMNRNGYWMLLMPDHPEAQNKYVFEHRIIMERHIGRRLLVEEVVHHKNFDRTDNRIENLVLLPNQSEHVKLHDFGQMQRRCSQ